MSEKKQIDSCDQIVVKLDNSVVIERKPVSPPGPGEVLVKTVRSLISAGTELGSQEIPRTDEFLPGYSNAGVITAVGEGVDDYQEGDRVLSLGQHASYVTVSSAPESLVLIPEGVTFDNAAFGVLGSVSMHGVRKAKIELGEIVAVTGMGLVGQLALQLAAAAGCEQLIAVDMYDSRLKIASECGATHTLNPSSQDLPEEIRRLTADRGLDVIIEASGYPEALLNAFDLARIGGRIVVLGSIWHRKVEVDFMPFHLKELTLIGCHQPKCPKVESIYYPWTQGYNRRQVLKMIGDGRLNVERLISHRLPYRDIEEGYRLLSTDRTASLGVVLCWD